MMAVVKIEDDDSEEDDDENDDDNDDYGDDNGVDVNNNDGELNSFFLIHFQGLLYYAFLCIFSLLIVTVVEGSYTNHNVNVTATVSIVNSL